MAGDVLSITTHSIVMPLQLVFSGPSENYCLFNYETHDSIATLWSDFPVLPVTLHHLSGSTRSKKRICTHRHILSALQTVASVDACLPLAQ